MSFPYPKVLSELETLDRVLKGESLARYGDGEFKLCRGADIKSQPYEVELATRLRQILIASRCLVGIPNIADKSSPKEPFWAPYRSMSRFLSKGRVYGSSFVTRPDSAPVIDTPEYWARVCSLWSGRAVTLVRGSEKSLTARMLVDRGADVVHEVIAPAHNAWAARAEILAELRKLEGQFRRVLLCLGPTATVLAEDLCKEGFHAVDLGHIGMFLKRRPA